MEEKNKIIDLLKLLRPQQWIKNFFVFAPLFFSFEFKPDLILKVTIAFFLFSFSASAIYIINDLKDIEEDKKHPKKKMRPIASGRVSKEFAIILFIIIFSTSLVLSYVFNKNFFYIISFYSILNILYSFKLKHIPIIDIAIIGVGFILRIYAGAVTISKPLSSWIVLITFVLALFIAIAKRRDDLVLAGKGNKTRKNIDGYNFAMVNSSITLMGGITIVAYMMYCVSPETIQKYGTDNLFLTSFFVIIGILRYMQVTFVEGKSGDPTVVILNDKFLQFTVLLWIISFYIIARFF